MGGAYLSQRSMGLNLERLDAHLRAKGTALVLSLYAAGGPLVRLLNLLPASVGRLSWVLGAAIPLVGLLAPNALTGLFVLYAALLAVRVPLSHRVPHLQARMMILLAAFFLWGATTLIWAPELEPAAIALAQSLPLFLLGAFCARQVLEWGAAEARGFAQGLIAGSLLCVTIYLFDFIAAAPIAQWMDERQRGEFIFGVFARGQTLLAFLVWPLALYATPRFGAWILLAPFLLLLSLFSADNLAPLAALAFGLILAALAWRWAKAAWALSLAAVAAGWFVWPWIGLLFYRWGWHLDAALPLTTRFRVEIWNYAASRVLERPILGWGPDSSLALAKEAPTPINHIGDLLPSHPHNATLQLWLDLGLPGALLLAAMIVLLLWQVRRLSQSAQAMAYGFFGTWLVVFLTSYSFWRARFIATCLVALAVFFLVERLGRAKEKA